MKTKETEAEGKRARKRKRIRKLLIGAGGIVLGVIVTCAVGKRVRVSGSIPELTESAGSSALLKVVPSTAAPAVELTGVMRTARGIGDLMHESAQSVNRRLCEAGYETRLPCGEWLLTESGKEYGTRTIKVPKSGHTFANNEWDEAIIQRIYSPEEIARAAMIDKLAG